MKPAIIRTIQVVSIIGCLILSLDWIFQIRKSNQTHPQLILGEDCALQDFKNGEIVIKLNEVPRNQKVINALEVEKLDGSPNKADLPWCSNRCASDPVNTDLLNFVQSFKEVVHCTSKERIGEVGDGGKWTCHPQNFLRNEKENCVVYSFGSNAIVGFELGIHSMAPNCEIHVFDPTPGMEEEIAKLNLPKDIHFHYLGLVTDKSISLVLGGKEVPAKTLDGILEYLGHKRISLLKIDIEESELTGTLVDTSPNSIWRKVGHLQIEVHLPREERRTALLRLHRDLYRVGLRLFHKELNLHCPFCWEFAYVNPEVMKDSLSTPYTTDQIVEYQTKFMHEIQEERERYSLWDNSPLFYFLLHPMDMKCLNKGTILGQSYFSICYDPWLEYPKEKRLVYMFSENDEPSNIWTNNFISNHPQTEVHSWSFDKSNGKGIISHDLGDLVSKSDESNLSLPSGALLSLYRKLSHEGLGIDVLHISLGDGIKTILNNLSDLKALKKKNSPLQLTLETSLCNYRHIQGSRAAYLVSLLNSIEKEGFINFDKTPNVPKFRTPENGCTWVSDEDPCEHILSFILY